MTTHTHGIIFTPVECYEVVVPDMPVSYYSSKTEDATFRVEARDGGYQLVDWSSSNDPRYGWAQDLEGIADLIRTHAEELVRKRAEYVEKDRERTAAWKQYDKDFAEWTAEQMERVEMVPCMDLVDGDVAAVVSKGEIHPSFAVEGVYNDVRYDTGEFDKYRLYDAHTWHAGDKAFDRQVKATSKVRAIRAFSRPEPVRP